MYRSFLMIFLVFSIASTASVAVAENFRASDYSDVKSRKNIPSLTAAGPLMVVQRYIASMPFLDAQKMSVTVLLDAPGRRVFRIEHICKSIEECGDDSIAARRDDSIAARRDALDIRRNKVGLWVLRWIGGQVRCRRGRGHQDWSRAYCQ